MRTKRKYTDMNENDNTKKRIRPYLKLSNAPPVNTINDLIEIGKTIQFYKNLDTIMLWRITPYLEEINVMIGMKELKETVFLQVIYYLKGFHLRNNNEVYPPAHRLARLYAAFLHSFAAVGVPNCVWQGAQDQSRGRVRGHVQARSACRCV